MSESTASHDPATTAAGTAEPAELSENVTTAAVALSGQLDVVVTPLVVAEFAVSTFAVLLELLSIPAFDLNSSGPIKPAEAVVLAAVVVSCPLYLASYFGIYRRRGWGRWLYLTTSLFLIVVVGLAGFSTTTESWDFAAAVGHVATLVSGALLLALFPDELIRFCRCLPGRAEESTKNSANQKN